MGISYSKDQTVHLFQRNNLETQQIDCLLHPEFNLLFYQIIGNITQIE